ncbi:VanZ like family protein [Botrimarina colliarenosi]|uniref:VanZ like family protein n=1 Tax=Botrimarina colliarenosi TaxID=2528001 RepID=A0A5C6AKE7_9BACT|nr:VanZ family protein [Botrimarina colliarenosi]TWT99977.1 VanZ like family protein [Botrimarina colliarenosi]
MTPGPATLPAVVTPSPASEALDASGPREGRGWRKTAAYWLAALVFYWLLLFIGTHIPDPQLPGPTLDYDKFMHAGAYAVLTTLLLIACRRTGASPRLWGRLAVAGLVLLYGAIDEVTQPYFGRSCDLLDWLADLAGVSLAVVVDAWRHRRG